MQFAVSNALEDRPIGEVIQAVAEQLLDARYRAGLLDEEENETLIISFAEFDCVLYVETVLALAAGIVVGDYSFGNFMRRLESYRYRGGKMDGYCSRLHFFTDWIVDNQRRGPLRDITEEIGGEAFQKPINFMTANRSSYPKLQDHQVFTCIGDVESNLSGRALYYVPQELIREKYSRLLPGDLVAMVTDIQGLDVVHTGFVFKGRNGETGLIHASTSGGVRVERDLHRYVGSVKRQIGIMVVRAEDFGGRP